MRITASAPPSSRATLKEWLGLAVLLLPTMVLTMDLTVLHLAIPDISAELAPSSTQVLWITDVYGFLVAGFLLVMGNLGDRIGRRRLLLLGAAAFAAASALAAYSTSAEMLIAARAVLGVAGATLMPSTMALLRTMFRDERQRTTAISVWMGGFMVGGVLGPLVGGAILSVAWWGAVFLLAIPVMGLLLVVGPVLLPESSDPAPARIDLVSAVVSTGGILALVYALKEIVQHGIGVRPAAAFLAGLVLLVAFVRRQTRLADPFLDVSLFRRPVFGIGIAAMTVGGAVMLGFNLFTAQYLQLVEGHDTLVAGLWLLPQTGGMVVGLGVTSAIAARVRPVVVLAGGLAAAAAGYVLIALTVGESFGWFIAGTVVAAVGLAGPAVLATTVVLSAAPPERAGAASAISETSNELGGALGLAVLGSIGAAAYRASVDGLTPADLPAPTDTAIRDSIGGAITTARDLPGDLGGQVVDAARLAFVNATAVTAYAGAALVAAMAVIALVGLRKLTVATEQGQESADASR
ncbi:MFS transporter [Actinokineospora sp. UTMC 2448]|uniref:MFS transporter n=1 Tax=Actinokineospora sp. UTMC 2448 TaxID=2268449 RepID=UPI0021645D29|nr:MFS transporter [Actinokineospora sp. UTMC 2448]UVS78204.1 Antiseptic resistance protein [Actinokineospora sp. UTMC 2448]